MKLFKIIILIITGTFIFAQDNETISTSVSIGSMTIDGGIYNQVSLRPEIPIGKLGLGLDVYVYFNNEGIYPGNWDFSDGNAFSTIIDKIYYIRWGKPGDNLYFKVGALPRATLGQGILVNNYSNIMEYPQVRRVGLDFKIKFMDNFGVEVIHSNFKKIFPGVLAGRFSYDPFPRLSVGLSYVTDLDQNQGLRDRDGDGYPDYFDQYPDESDKYGIAREKYNSNPDFWHGLAIEDCSGENLNSDECQSKIDMLLMSAFGDDYNHYDPQSSLVKNPISALSLDLVLKLSKKTYLYSQFGQLIGETDNSKVDNADLGYGIVPIGLHTKLGPLNFRVEYRMSSRNFVFSYWDQAYDLNRAIAQNDGIVTKESQLYKYGELNGFYMNINSNLFDFVYLDASYQKMAGEIWDDNAGYFIDDANQTLMGKVSLNTRKIAKLDVAEVFYQQSNVTNPFDFEPNETSISGYTLGFEVSAGMTLVYKSRTTYNPDGEGGFTPVSSMQIETQIKF